MNIKNIVNTQFFKANPIAKTTTPHNISESHLQLGSLLDIDYDVFTRVSQESSEKNRIYSEIVQTRKTPARHTRLGRQVTNLKNLENLRKQCAITDSLLDASEGIKYTQDQKIIAAYVDRMRRLDRNKGLNKIFGYEDVKEKLYDNFILKVMAKDKVSDNNDMPNVFLFYGPTGCGKTYFAKALAEQTLSKIKVVNATESDPKDTLETIKKLAQESAQNYEQSAADRQRTIIVINEADFFAYPGSDIIDEFKEFISSCAKKYKCILFLTTNYPLDLDSSILSKESTPYKIGISCPDRTEAKKIIRDKIAFYAKRSINGEELLNELFKSPDGFYSTKQIDMLIEITLKNNNDPKEQDYIETLRKYLPHPSIPKDGIREYRRQQEILDSM